MKADQGSRSSSPGPRELGLSMKSCANAACSAVVGSVPKLSWIDSCMPWLDCRGIPPRTGSCFTDRISDGALLEGARRFGGPGEGLPIEAPKLFPSCLPLRPTSGNRERVFDFAAGGSSPMRCAGTKTRGSSGSSQKGIFAGSPSTIVSCTGRRRFPLNVGVYPPPSSRPMEISGCSSIPEADKVELLSEASCLGEACGEDLPGIGLRRARCCLGMVDHLSASLTPEKGPKKDWPA